MPGRRWPPGKRPCSLATGQASCARHGHELNIGREMFGSSDSNRSESQGGLREEGQLKEGRSQGTTVGRRTGREAAMRAMSVRENAKSKSHRKTHQVEPDGTESKMFMHLTRGDLRWESGGEVSRGRSSEESRGNTEGAKGRRTKRGPSANHPAGSRREDSRNNPGVATTAATQVGGKRVEGGILQRHLAHDWRVEAAAKGGVR